MDYSQKTFSVKEVATHFGVSTRTIYNQINEGYFVGVVKVGRKFAISKEVLDNYYKQNS